MELPDTITLHDIELGDPVPQKACTKPLCGGNIWQFMQRRREIADRTLSVHVCDICVICGTLYSIQ